MLDIATEVSDALSSNKAVVALESTIISHGMPYPRNVETAMAVEAAVRAGGAVPATIAVLDGKLKVGLSPDEVQTLGKLGMDAIKCSRRLGSIVERTGGRSLDTNIQLVLNNAGVAAAIATQFAPKSQSFQWSDSARFYEIGSGF